MTLDEADAVAGERMGLQIGADARAGQQALLVEDLEELQEPGRPDPGAVEIAHRRLVRALLLAARERQEALLGHRGATGDDRTADLWCTGGSGRRAEKCREQRLDRRVLLGIRQTDEMAAGDVPGLVRDDAGELLGRRGAHQKPGEQEQILPAGDEGVQAVVTDEVDAHA